MKIIVLVKQVPAPEALITVQPDNQHLEIENKYVLNFFDELAVEEALRIKERLSGEITAISLGPRRAMEALRTCLALGVNRAILVNDPQFDNADNYATANILTRLIKKIPFDIMLCGKEAMDDNACQVGPAVAEILAIPHISTITKLEISDDQKTARVERQIEGGKEIVNVSLPALFTTQKGINEPRVPLVSGIMKAMRTKIEEMNLASLGLNPEEVNQIKPKTRILKYYSPAKRAPVKIIEGELPDKVKIMVRLLREESKII